MSNDRLQKARELMTVALSMDEAERTEFLKRETAGDGEWASCTPPAW